MKSRQLSDTTILIVLDKGDEAIEMLQQFAAREEIQSAHFTAIGAFEKAKIAWWSWDRKEYLEYELDEQIECLSLTGNITRAEDGHKIHAHVTLGRSDGNALGGHLLEGHVRPILEIFLTTTPTAVQRRKDEATGLTLIDLP
jgi:uncharacterized protein